MENKTARLIAFYLPQYHPIPENDEWWGKGFTEWTNVAKARPLFPEHYQPHLPADLGFYDLRVPEVREAQAQMAREAGIEGFCYWHYWFAGRRLLERPFTEVLESGKPDFPFCLAWANQSWTGIWHGAPNRLLIEQTYPGKEDHINHFFNIFPAFNDERYIRIDDKPIFLVLHPDQMINPREFVDTWRMLAEKEGLKGIYFIAVHSKNYEMIGFDGCLVHSMERIFNNFKYLSSHRIDRAKFDLPHKRIIEIFSDLFLQTTIRHYEDMIKYKINYSLTENLFPVAITNWDNTPRLGNKGLVFHSCTPDLFKQHLLAQIDLVQDHPSEKKIVFIKSWNEWAEGNYLEPDLRFGHGFLEAVKSAVENR